MIKPLGDRVVVKPAPKEKELASGFQIPDTAQEKPQTGTIVAAGVRFTGEPVSVKVGDKVIHNKNAGTEITIDGAKHLIMRESDLIAII